MIQATPTARSARRLIARLLLTGVALLAWSHIALADDGGGSDSVRQLRQEVERDAKLIQDLEHRLGEIEAQNRKLDNATQEVEISNAKLRSQTTQQLQELQNQMATTGSSADFSSAMSRYLGTHQFTFAGAAAGDFIYDRDTAQNTFSLQFEPIALYRLNDWILFEGTINALLPVGSKSDFELPVATAQLFLNDYLEINAGIFDQPFGDWLEDQSPLWVNRFITAPLLYGAEAVVPPTDIGVQARGSLQWGALGQDLDYTAWIANGPSFDSALPTPVVGQSLNPQNNIALNTNGRAFGTRIRVYPLPLDAGLGRLELGASTYDGKWQNSLWFNAWGLDFAYLNNDLQTPRRIRPNLPTDADRIRS
jgi:hypothetical protein